MDLLDLTAKFFRENIRKVLKFQWLLISLVGVLAVIYSSALTETARIKDSQAATPTSVPNPNGTITMSQVAQHNNASSCWEVVYYRVYDLTNYHLIHPGGSEIVVGECGTDATQAYITKLADLPEDHSDIAYLDLQEYYIGDLKVETGGGGNGCGLMDTNGDNQLTLPDFSAFGGFYLKSCTDNPASTGCGKKDSNSNGRVDIGDFAVFSSKYRKPTCS